MDRPMILVIVASLKRKLLFSFRLLLLLIIISILITQLYGILATTATGGASAGEGFPDRTTPWGGVVDFFKDYYRGRR